MPLFTYVKAMPPGFKEARFIPAFGREGKPDGPGNYARFGAAGLLEGALLAAFISAVSSGGPGE